MEIIKNTLYLDWNNPRHRFTLGLDNQILVQLVHKDEDDEEPIVNIKYELTIGFLFFNITIIY